MKKLTKLFIILFAFIISLNLIACGKKTENKESKKQESTELTYEVSYINSDIKSTKVEPQSKLEKPTDPEKKDHIFGGWYLDEKGTAKAEFPLTITSDTKLYAIYLSYEDAFKDARNNTIGENVNSYEYDYNVDCSCSYNSLTLTGNTTGNAKYNKDSEVSFYDEHTNSGILFYDGSKYQIRRNTELQKIALNENDILNKFESITVDASYKYDSDSFSKALFEYKDEDLKSIEATSVKGKYKLNTSFNFSKAVSVLGKLLNNSLVQKAISNIPESNAVTDMFVTFENGEVKTYTYEMHINVESIKFDLVYTLTFKNINKVSIIAPKTFSGLSLSNNEINTTKSEINNYLNAFKNSLAGGYDYKLHTGINFPSKNEIDSTIKGYSKHAFVESNLYFHNDIDISTDLVNADLYKDVSLENIHTKRTKLTTGEIYDIEKKLLKDNTVLKEDYTETDNDKYYLFDILNQLNNIVFIQKITKDTTIKYAIGVNNSDVVNMINYLENSVDLDPFNRTGKDILLLGSIDSSTIDVKEVEIVVEIENGSLKSITVESKGTVKTCYNDSRDFKVLNDSDYRFEYEINVNSDYLSFNPYTQVKDAK